MTLVLVMIAVLLARKSVCYVRSHPPGSISAVPSVSFGSLTTPSHDIVPLTLMLPHMLNGSLATGRNGFKDVFIQVNGDISSVAENLRTLRVEVLSLDLDRRYDHEFFARFFKDPSALNLHELHNPIEDPSYPDTLLAILIFLERCQSTYCVWMDSDILVHRPPGKPGWIDHAVALLEINHRETFLTSPHLSEDMPIDKACTTKSVRYLSQRYMVLHKARFMSHFPLEIACAPKCDTFEAMMHALGPGMSMACPRSGPWVAHPPRMDSYLKLLRDCAPQCTSDMECLWKGLQGVLAHIEDLGNDQMPNSRFMDGEDLRGDVGYWACDKKVFSLLLQASK